MNRRFRQAAIYRHLLKHGPMKAATLLAACPGDCQTLQRMKARGAVRLLKGHVWAAIPGVDVSDGRGSAAGSLEALRRSWPAKAKSKRTIRRSPELTWSALLG